MEARSRKVLVFLVPPLKPSTKTDPLSPPPVPGITPEQYQSSQRRLRLERTWIFSPRSDLPTWSNRRPGVEPGTIQALPVYCYGGGKEMYEIKDCAICLGEFEENEAIKEIPFCKHVFHPHCIDRWLYSHVTCPVCRSIRLFDDKGVSQSNSAITRSTAGNQDTCVEVIRVAADIESHGTFGLRNSSSCSSFGSEPISMLPRTYSF
ncbi:RING-H2 finger protein ATL57-like isoform X2 [Juglans microcarpa x Juglans regia]|uniref:RING-H2 finger protein ATL57-like isoform X2 n=1 Tax=Juglans microcarpa x Juglans regia TaxID=2249226 RepID=UPI001B7DE128|nr:RING-H2 finger protein ATL57-like isoform X2 [Juglans microcarpa x Juglans regia]